MNTEMIRTHVSKKKKTKNGQKLQQSVYLTAVRKNKKGKTIFASQTRHELQN